VRFAATEFGEDSKMKDWCLGIDLCDDYSQISYYNRRTASAEAISADEDENRCLIPTILCRHTGSGKWFMGHEAYSQALAGEGVIVDHLVSMAAKSGVATIEGESFTAQALMEIFVGRLLEPILADEESRIIKLAFTMQKLEPTLMDVLVKVADSLKISRDAIHLMSHTEAFLYYVLSKRPESAQNVSCLFDLTESGIHYYEMHTIRTRKPQIIEGIHEELEEGFNLDILRQASGMKRADAIASECAQRMMGKKIIQAVFLTGKGFEKTDWAREFLKQVCPGRRVFAGQNLFAQGAAYIAWDRTRPETIYPYVCLCEGRIASTITMEARHQGKKCQLVIASAGTNWNEARANVELIVDGEEALEFHVQTLGKPPEKTWVLPLEDLPKRPPKTTRLELIVAFINENSVMVRVVDKGFGEMFPASGMEIKQYFTIESQ